MKIKIFFSFVLLVLTITMLVAQNVTTRTNEFEVDFSDPKKLVYTTIPVINWISPSSTRIPSQNSRERPRLRFPSFRDRSVRF